MTIYHVETQEDYDALMIEIEEKGYKWLSGHKPTSKNYWEQVKENTCIKISGEGITFRDIEQCKKQYPNILIIEYKAKGENMEEENKHNLQKIAFDVSVAIESFARDISNAEKELQEAKSASKSLIEKIDEYPESLKPKFKVGDYVTVDVNDRTIIAKIDELSEKKTEAHGIWYDKTKVNVKQDFWFLSKGNIFRHATPEEIAEYEVALIFHKHGRKPFEVRQGDIISYNESDKFIVDYEDIEPEFETFDKENFIRGDLTFLKTAEEVNEWLENK